MSKIDRLRKTATKQASLPSGGSQVSVILSRREAILAGLSGDKGEERPHVSLRYYYPKYQCLSEWTSDELKAFSSFCTKLNSSRWSDIYKTGGSLGNKSGLGYTVHRNSDSLPNNPEISNFSLDITWFELRVTGQARVHGFRIKDAFFLVFLDREHNVYRG